MISDSRSAQLPAPVSHWHAIAFTLAASLLMAFYCLAIDLRMMPFRGESGLFIARAWAHEGGLAFIKPMLFRAYNGHFTPLFFGLEFLQSGWFGANVRWWFARQMLVLGLLSSSMYLLGRSALGFTSLGVRASAAVAALAALLFTVQPTVLELATWPFMAAQLLCIACGAMATSNLLTAARTGQERPVFWALGWGYASMHLFGVGFTISATVLIAAVMLIWARKLPTRTWGGVGLIGVLTLIHASIMARTTASVSADTAVTWGDQVIRTGALYMGSIQAGARSLWSNGRFPWPNPDSYATDAVYGYALLVTFAVASVVLLWKGRREHKPLLIANGLLVGMFAVVLAVYSALIVYRLQHDPAAGAINPFLFGTRYLIFPAFFVFLLIPLLLVTGARALGPWLVLPMSAVGGGAAIATYVFFATVTTLWPIFATPFPVTWAGIVADARAQLDADGYVHDRKLPEIDPEFHADLNQFQGLLEHSLGCTGCTRFAPAPVPTPAPAP